MENTSGRFHISLDKLPSFSNESVIFISNIFSLFYGNKEQVKALHKEVGALASYGGRMLPILNLLFKGECNLIVLEKKPDPVLVAYFDELGLSLPDMIIESPNDQSKLRKICDNHSAQKLIGYVIDHDMEALTELVKKTVIGSSEGSRAGNNKLLLHNFLDENGFPTFDSFVAEKREDVSGLLSKLSQKGYQKAVIKSQIGASGIGMKKIKNINEVNPDIPAYLFHEGPVLVQGWLDEHISHVKYLSSPSTLLFVEDENVFLYDVTDQILSSDSVHEGNISPASFMTENEKAKNSVLDQAEAVGNWLHAQGYRGTASIDFHLIERRGKVEVRVCEINARVTGATYPSLLAKHFLPQNAWLLRNIRFPEAKKGKEIVESLRKAGLLFEKGKTSGILPFNFNPNESGKIFKAQFLFMAETKAKIFTLIDEVTRKVLSPGVFDRD